MKYLVLDLDNTFVFWEKKQLRSSKIIKNVILRPYLFDFLNTLKSYYLLNIFTSAKKSNCEIIYNKIRSKNYNFFKILHRSSLINGKKNLASNKYIMKIRNILDVRKGYEYTLNLYNLIFGRPKQSFCFSIVGINQENDKKYLLLYAKQKKM